MATRAYLTCLLMTMLIHTGIANQSHKTIASEAECSSFKRVNDSQDSSCPMVPVILLKNNGKHPSTYVIRPAAIYGLGEERRFPRIISFAKLGLLPSKVGSPINSFEFLQPLLRRMGYDVPKDSLSVPHALMLE
ncbi:hypothetical protein Peur_014543 [Populus x canadensis]